jgi:DNA repair protein RecO (recombination protein O)
MPVFEADAIVLRQYSLSDSDRIIVFITKEFGKVRAAAQGVKKPQSRISGSLEPFNHLRVEFWSREGRDLCQIRRAELMHSFTKGDSDFKKICAFSYFSEMTNELIQENQANPALFRLILSCFHAGEQLPINSALIRYFELWSLKLNGLLPNYAYCSNCGKCVKEEVFFAWLEAGQARCADCAQGRGLRISQEAAIFMEAMMHLPPEKLAAQPVAKEALIDVEHLANKLLSINFEKKLKSYRLLKEALRDQ